MGQHSICLSNRALFPCLHSLILTRGGSGEFETVTREFKIPANLKRHNRVNILSSKHIYRPIRASVFAQIFYKIISLIFTLHAGFDINHLATLCQGYEHMQSSVAYWLKVTVDELD